MKEVRRKIFASWVFTVLGMINMLFVAGALGLMAMRFIGPMPALSLVAAAIFIPLIMFLFSETLITIVMDGQRVKENEHPHFLNAIDELSRKKRMWFRPRTYILHRLPMPNAMAFGWGFFGQYAIGITPALYDMLGPDELKGVVAHELAHIRCKDVGVMMIITMLTNGLAKIASKFLKGGSIFGKGPIAYLVGGVLWFINKYVFAMLRAAVSQEREFTADALGASYTGDPDALASALRKISKSYPKKEEKKSVFSDLFISHPNMDDRIHSLQQLKEV